MHEIRRESDGELCGHVVAVDGRWQALTVFGAALGAHDSRETAESQVLDEGLACLAERWMYRASADDEWQVVCIVEARPDAVRIALDYYALPGVPVVEVPRQQVMTDGVLVRNG